MDKRILFISHDGNRAGAQLLLLDVMLYLKKKGVQVHLLLLEDYGDVFEQYAGHFNIYKLPKETSKKLFKRGVSHEAYIKDVLIPKGIDLIYANTIASSHFAPLVKDILQVPLIAHIHEMQYSISQYSAKEDVSVFFEKADSIIACSLAVKEQLEVYGANVKEKLITIHSFVDLSHLNIDKNYREAFNLPENKILVGACGNAEWRKGTDWFLETAYHLRTIENIHFVWIGFPKEGKIKRHLEFDKTRMGLNNISFIPITPKAKELIHTLDIFFLSSREDPFPLAMLEAALMAKPIIAFKKAGGCEELLMNNSGILCEYGDIKEVTEAILSLEKDKNLRTVLGKKVQKIVKENYSYDKSMSSIFNHLAEHLL